VDEGVAIFGVGPADDLPPAERDEEDPAQRQERRRLEGEDALRWGRVDGDPGRPEPAVDEELDEEPAEGVANEDRRLVERADDALVVVDDLAQPEAGDRLLVLAKLLDVPFLPRPFRRRGRVAAPLEELLEALPAPGREPRTGCPPAR